MALHHGTLAQHVFDFFHLLANEENIGQIKVLQMRTARIDD